MKIILRIMVILAVAAIVAGTTFLAINNTAIVSGSGGEGGQPPAMTGTNGIRPERPEGGEKDGASIGRGLFEVVTTLTKLSVIAVLVLLVQKGISQLTGKRAKNPASG